LINELEGKEERLNDEMERVIERLANAGVEYESKCKEVDAVRVSDSNRSRGRRCHYSPSDVTWRPVCVSVCRCRCVCRCVGVSVSMCVCRRPLQQLRTRRSGSCGR
jgi:hypothetical protein